MNFLKGLKGLIPFKKTQQNTNGKSVKSDLDNLIKTLKEDIPKLITFKNELGSLKKETDKVKDLRIIKALEELYSLNEVMIKLYYYNNLNQDRKNEVPPPKYYENYENIQQKILETYPPPYPDINTESGGSKIYESHVKYLLMKDEEIAKLKGSISYEDKTKLDIYYQYLNTKRETFVIIIDKIRNMKEAYNKLKKAYNELEAYNEIYSKQIYYHSKLSNLVYKEDLSYGGNIKIKKINKKNILGKERCIYKISGNRKEYVKHKGELITVNDYKKIIKLKNKK